MSYVVNRSYILLMFLFFLVFFLCLLSELTKWKLTKLCHVMGSEPDLQMHVKNLGSIKFEVLYALAMLRLFELALALIQQILVMTSCE